VCGARERNAWRPASPGDYHALQEGETVTLLEQLGFSADDRVAVVHVDDLGMSTAANRGALRAFEGAATCGSIMVPCPGFDEIASVARERPELDLGVHLTLNAEYETHRWGPLRDDVPGLVSPDGGMWRTTRDVIERASPDEVERELRAQIDRALDAGIDVTHLDSHMGTVFHYRFIGVYLKLVRDYRLPALIPRVRREDVEALGLADKLANMIQLVAEVEADGFPIFDRFDADSLSFEPGSGHAHNTARLDAVEAGLTYLITHCAQGGAELEAITPVDWRQRAEEAELYSDGTMHREIESRSIRTVGMRALREWLRS
jgi:predicted glycoside hydrolase/deacetylase ChbG (UPF0249 family)